MTAPADSRATMAWENVLHIRILFVELTLTMQVSNVPSAVTLVTRTHLVLPEKLASKVWMIVPTRIGVIVESTWMTPRCGIPPSANPQQIVWMANIAFMV